MIDLISMSIKEKVFNKNLLSLKYVPSDTDNRVQVLSKNYDLPEIARLTHLSTSSLKKDYAKGLNLLTNLVNSYYIIVDYDYKDIDKYIQDNNIEELWENQSCYYSYIPYIGIEEFAVLYKTDPSLLEKLKKNKGV